MNRKHALNSKINHLIKDYRNDLLMNNKSNVIQVLIRLFQKIISLIKISIQLNCMPFLFR